MHVEKYKRTSKIYWSGQQYLSDLSSTRLDCLGRLFKWEWLLGRNAQHWNKRVESESVLFGNSEMHTAAEMIPSSSLYILLSFDIPLHSLQFVMQSGHRCTQLMYSINRIMQKRHNSLISALGSGTCVIWGVILFGTIFVVVFFYIVCVWDHFVWYHSKKIGAI